MSDPGPNATAQQILKQIPAEFHDDGCSNVPDGWLCTISKRRGFGWLKRFSRSFMWCCKIHDWRYCSRAHRAGGMNQTARAYADKELGWNIRGVLPVGLRWWGWLYWKGTSGFGGTRAWNSCGPASGERCRHNMPKPDWMAALAEWSGG